MNGWAGKGAEAGPAVQRTHSPNHAARRTSVEHEREIARDEADWTDEIESAD